MASYREHLAFSTSLGVLYGALAHRELAIDPATAILGGGLTAVGGMLPDLDSSSGMPVREMFGLAAAVVPMLLWRRFMNANVTDEQLFVFMGGIYLTIRFVLPRIFKHLAVHRGMFHSIPGMLIAGLIVYLSYHHPLVRTRLFLAIGVMIGFLSHLILDEIWSVDFQGVTVRLSKSAGSALKFVSPSLRATMTAYLILLALLYLGIEDYEKQTGTTILPPSWRWEKVLRIEEIFQFKSNS
jgi:hypothetical protein